MRRDGLARPIYQLLPEASPYYFRVPPAISVLSEASAELNVGLEPSCIWPDAALDLPKPVEPCSICQRLVDYSESSCTEEEPDSDTHSACVLATWSAIRHNDKCLTCRKVVRTSSRLGASDLCTEDAHIRVTQPWEGNRIH